MSFGHTGGEDGNSITSLDSINSEATGFKQTQTQNGTQTLNTPPTQTFVVNGENGIEKVLNNKPAEGGDSGPDSTSLESGADNVEPLHSAQREERNEGLQHEISARTTNSVKTAKTGASARTGNTVAMKDKRGLFAQVALLPEYEDPRNYPPAIKHTIVLVVAFAAICGPMGTSIMLPAIDDVVAELNTSVSVVNVSVGIYLLSLGIFPLWWSAFSENHGRRSVYLISFTLFVGFSIGCALAPSIGALIVFRVLCGGCSASVQAVGAGTIGDLYPQSERGRAMGWYYLGPLMGPFLAPILGGVVAQVWGWRATQWVLVIASGIADVMILFLLPETLRKQDDLANVKKLLAAMHEEQDHENADGSDLEKEDSRKPSLQMVRSALSEVSRIQENEARAPGERLGSAHEQAEEREVEHEAESMFNEQGVGDSIMPTLSRLTTNRSTFSKKMAMEQLHHELSRSLTHEKLSKGQKFRKQAYEYIVRPMHSVALLAYPPVALVIAYSSISFALIYFFNITISYEYSRPPYNFSTIIVGLCYIPNSVTYVLASILGGRWNDMLLRKYAKNHNGEMRPEARISWNIVTAVVLFPPSCLIFGWTLDKGVHWVVPLVGTALFGFASMLVIGTTVTYLVDTLPGKGATGVALNNLIRQVLAAIGTFIVEPLIGAIGTGPLYCILTGIIFFATGILIFLKKRGDKLRATHDLSYYYDLL